MDAVARGIAMTSSCSTQTGSGILHARDGRGRDAGARDAASCPGRGAIASRSFSPMDANFFFWVGTGHRQRAGHVRRDDRRRRVDTRARSRTAAVYAPPGRCCGCDEGVLVAQRFDPARGWSAASRSLWSRTSDWTRACSEACLRCRRPACSRIGPAGENAVNSPGSIAQALRRAP